MAGLLPVAALARLGMPALAALVFLAMLVLATACWVISSDDRSARVTRIIYARRGDVRGLQASTSAASSTAPRPRGTRGRPATDTATTPAGKRPPRQRV